MLIMENTNQLLTKEQAAVVLQISTQSLDRIVKKGEIIPTRIGKFVRFKPDVISDYLNRAPDLQTA
jgi:excisionase family DNA binding protein